LSLSIATIPWDSRFLNAAKKLFTAEFAEHAEPETILSMISAFSAVRGSWTV